jgi:hypothetical protein
MQEKSQLLHTSVYKLTCMNTFPKSMYHCYQSANFRTVSVGPSRHFIYVKSWKFNICEIKRKMLRHTRIWLKMLWSVNLCTTHQLKIGFIVETLSPFLSSDRKPSGIVIFMYRSSTEFTDLLLHCDCMLNLVSLLFTFFDISSDIHIQKRQIAAMFPYQIFTQINFYLVWMRLTKIVKTGLTWKFFLRYGIIFYNIPSY